MRKSVPLLVAVAIALTLPPSTPPSVEADAWTRVFINGQIAPVHFNDGDSFRVQGGELSGTQCRLGGFNTLESFGPAHQWGDWHPYELYVNAKQATTHARRGVWHCFGDGSRDGYGRLLLDCPDLAISHISHGYAHAYNIDDTPSRPEYLRAQQEAIRERRGMWAHGVPEYVMTSIHSADEDPARDFHYNRLVSTYDGHTESDRHRETYGECEWVCDDEIHADEDAVTAAARRMREDRALAPLLAEHSNLHLMEFARRYARIGELPEYVSAAARAPLEARLAQERAQGLLGTTRTEPGSCALYVEFTRRYGRERASCLREHGTAPPGTRWSH
ncbi:MAG: thermonuclease family protein [Myxococcota bacterium]|nr:thermonuclease family protein [Myxococcota bacterium]